MLSEVFSASDLVKKSATQMKYLRGKVSGPASSRKKEGVDYQDEVASGMQEMRGTYRARGITIFFSNDEVVDGVVVEHKNVPPDECEEWYFRQCLIQCAFYKSMISLGANRLETATFRRRQGAARDVVTVNTDCEYILDMKGELFSVDCRSSKKIVGHFVKKAVASLDYKTARAWDRDFKHRDWDAVGSLISHRKGVLT